MLPQHHGAEGGQVWSNYWESVRMYNKMVFTTDKSVDQNVFLVEFGVYSFSARVETRTEQTTYRLFAATVETRR